jgi:hypothetical protein
MPDSDELNELEVAEETSVSEVRSLLFLGEITKAESEDSAFATQNTKRTTPSHKNRNYSAGVTCAGRTFPNIHSLHRAVSYC